jgi:hypothetical protein|tara:strand:+ start:1674 stop:1952 length:279 start_codon:yes stop_codon:yes gene_type:complete
MARKTHSVAKILAKTNFLLSKPDFQISLDQKRILCMVIEDVLMSTDNYEGYGYNDPFVPELGSAACYRRRYYVSHTLRPQYESFKDTYEIDA